MEPSAQRPDFVQIGNEITSGMLWDEGREGEAPTHTMMRLALDSPARTVIVTLPDLLGLGTEARLNTPGRSV